MEPFDNCNYVVECTPDGTYYAYLLDYHQCCAYGETEEEALDNLADVAEDFTCCIYLALRTLFLWGHVRVIRRWLFFIASIVCNENRVACLFVQTTLCCVLWLTY